MEYQSKKAVDLFGIIQIVLFSPEDLNIIKKWSFREKKIYGYGAKPA